jgi:hypothetical protein
MSIEALPLTSPGREHENVCAERRTCTAKNPTKIKQIFCIFSPFLKYDPYTIFLQRQNGIVFSFLSHPLSSMFLLVYTSRLNRIDRPISSFSIVNQHGKLDISPTYRCATRSASTMSMLPLQLVSAFAAMNPEGFNPT